jgi:hypothetical protein
MNSQTEFVNVNKINRFKREGVPRKEIPYPTSKHAVSEKGKRVKNVARQRQSRRENQFVPIPRIKEEWPYEGHSDFLAGLRRECRLGRGW